MTNYENIKNNMGVEQLAELLYTIADDIGFKNCTRDTGNKFECRIGDDLTTKDCINCMKIWLESEV